MHCAAQPSHGPNALVLTLALSTTALVTVMVMPLMAIVPPPSTSSVAPEAIIALPNAACAMVDSRQQCAPRKLGAGNSRVHTGHSVWSQAANLVSLQHPFEPAPQPVRLKILQVPFALLKTELKACRSHAFHPRMQAPAVSWRAARAMSCAAF